jgi:GntR family transcriptional regulator, galactonate operon transcriptional repressor
MTFLISTPPIARPDGGSGAGVRDQVAFDIATRILGGHYPPGSVLPVEARLCAEFGISRTALREAVRMLAAKGLLEARQRAGTRVRPVEEWNRLDPDVLAWMGLVKPDLDFVRGLIEFRRILELAAAELAALRANAADLAAIEEGYMGMREHLPSDLDACSAADVRFHLAILRASRNPVLAHLAGVTGAALSSSFRLTTSASRSYERTLAAHGEVLEAIRMRDGKTARARTEFLISIAAEDIAGVGR